MCPPLLWQGVSSPNWELKFSNLSQTASHPDTSGQPSHQGCNPPDQALWFKVGIFKRKGKNRLWTSQMPNVFVGRLGLCCCHHVAAAWGSQAGTGGTEQAQNPHGCWTLLKILKTCPGHGEVGKFFSYYGLNLLRSQSVAGEVSWSCLPVLFLRSHIYVTNICCAHKNCNQNKGKSNQNQTMLL